MAAAYLIVRCRIPAKTTNERKFANLANILIRRARKLYRWEEFRQELEQTVYALGAATEKAVKIRFLIAISDYVLTAPLKNSSDWNPAFKHFPKIFSLTQFEKIPNFQVLIYFQEPLFQPEPDKQRFLFKF